MNTDIGAMGTHFDSVVLKTEGVKVSVLGRYEIEFGATTEKMVLELEVFFFNSMTPFPVDIRTLFSTMLLDMETSSTIKLQST